MSIKTQKLIRFIPIINFLVIGIQWLLLYHRNPVPKTGILKVVLGTFLCCIIVTIPEIILDSIFDNAVIERVINLIVSCLYLFIFSSIMIYDQEHFCIEK